MKWIFFSTTFFLRLHPFSLTTVKRTSQRRRTEGRNEANAKVRKAEEFPGVSSRVHFARNCATFLQNKVGKVIRRPSKTSVLFSRRINRSHVRRIRDGGKKRKERALWKESISVKGSSFHSHRYSECNIISSFSKTHPSCVPSAVRVHL